MTRKELWLAICLAKEVKPYYPLWDSLETSLEESVELNSTLARFIEFHEFSVWNSADYIYPFLQYSEGE